MEANDGSIWFGSMNGVYRYDERPSRTLKVKRVINDMYSRQFLRWKYSSGGTFFGINKQSAYLPGRLFILDFTPLLI